MKQTKSVDFEVKTAQSDDDFFRFEGFASTFGNTDLEGDIIVRGAFRRSLTDLRRRQRAGSTERGMFPMLFNHRMDAVIGSFQSARETDDGLEVKGRINRRIPLGDTVAELVKAGDVTGMSIGFIPTDRERIENAEGRFTGFEIREALLLETSVTPIPANQQALMKAVNESGAFEGAEKMRVTFDDIDEGMDVREIEEILTQAASRSVAKTVANFLVSRREAGNPAGPREVDGRGDSDILERLKALNANLRGEPPNGQCY